MGKFKVGDRVRIISDTYDSYKELWPGMQRGCIVIIAEDADAQGDYWVTYDEDFGVYFGEDELEPATVANTSLAREIHKDNILKIENGEIYLGDKK